MKLCVSRYSIPSQTSWHMERSQESFRLLPLCRRMFSRQPFSMNSTTISRGRCCKQTPYSCTSLGWHSLLAETTNTEFHFHGLTWRRMVSLFGLSFSLLPYIMTLASSMKSSSHIAPSLMALMATFCSALHLPSLTRPNWPLPTSFIKVSSLGLISHFSGKREQNRDKTEKGGKDEKEVETWFKQKRQTLSI